MRRLVRLLSCLAAVLTAFLALATAASGLKLSVATSSSQSSAGGPVVTAEPRKQSQTGPVVLGVVALVVAATAAVAAAPALVRFRRRTGERA
jgi:hypothetical protein